MVDSFECMIMHGLANPKFNGISSTAGVYKAEKDLEETVDARGKGKSGRSRWPYVLKREFKAHSLLGLLV